MRICFISQEYPPETASGGIGTYVQMMARELAALGHEIHVICQALREAYDTAEGPVQVHRVPARIQTPLVHRLLYPLFPSTLNSLAWTWSARRRFEELAAGSPFDIIEVPEFMAQGHAFRNLPHGRLVTKLHTPMFLVHELNRTPETTDLRVAKWLEKRATRASDAVTSCSADLGRLLRERWGLRHVETVHNPIDINQFHLNGTTAAEPVVVYAGTLSMRKGVDILGHAIPKVLDAVPDARFRFAGRDTKSAPEGDSMRDYVLALLTDAQRERVEFLGAVPHDAMREIYAKARVVAVPSRYENFPYSALEPMACGRAVIGSAVGGIPEIVVDGETGRLVPPEDPDALAAALVEVLSDADLAETRGRAARSRIEATFAGPVIARATEACYQKLLGGAA